MLWYTLGVRLSREKIHQLCSERGLSVSELIARARVSRNAFYSLLRRPSILPDSVGALAAELGTTELDLLELDSAEETRARARLRLARKICSSDPDITFQHVWHTLTLLELTPLQRIEGSLRRGRVWTA